MIRALPILAALPTLAACDISNFINPGSSSRSAYEAREAVTTPARTLIAQTPIPPTVEVAVAAPEVVEVVVPEPVYVPPEPQKPICQAVYAIFNCGPAGEIIWL
jgi:hypothetical protein